MTKKILLVLLALALLPVLFIAYVLADMSVIQPWKHALNTKNGHTNNEAELSDGKVSIHQLAFWVEIGGKRVKVWSELACAKKFRTAPRTLKSPGYSRFVHFGLNEAAVRFRISEDLDFVATVNAGNVCHLVANLEHDLPTVLRPNSYSVSIEPARQSCDRYVGLFQKDTFASEFGPLQVRSTRTVPMNEVFSRHAYAPDNVDASLHDDYENPVPDIRTHLDTLERSRCNS
jgi:hypothetical protein